MTHSLPKIRAIQTRNWCPMAQLRLEKHARDWHLYLTRWWNLYRSPAVHQRTARHSYRPVECLMSNLRRPRAAAHRQSLITPRRNIVMPADWVYYSAQARHYSREPSIGSRELLSMRATDWTLHSHYAIVAGAIAIINLVSALQHRHGERRTGRNEGLTGPYIFQPPLSPPNAAALSAAAASAASCEELIMERKRLRKCNLVIIGGLTRYT